MAEYDGSILYFNIDYDWAFFTIINNDFYCMDEKSVTKVCEHFGDDWYCANCDKEIEFYYNNEKHTIEHYERVHLIGCKSQEYAVLLFIEGEDANNRNVHLNLINPETGECLEWCPTIKRDYTEWRIIGVANTTPNTKVVVMGNNKRFIAFYSTLMTWQKDMTDYQCLLSDVTTYNDSQQGWTQKVEIASMRGRFAKTLITTKFLQTAYSGTYPFKALAELVVSDIDDVFVSIGDVLQAVQDTKAPTSKVVYNNVDYCRYTSRGDDNITPTLWFRAYGGSNNV